MALSACYIHRAEARRRRQNSYRSIGRSDDDITVSGAFGRQDTLDSARSPGRANPPQRSDSFAFAPSDQVDRGAATSTSADQLPNIHEVDSPAANWISQLVSQHQQLPLETVSAVSRQGLAEKVGYAFHSCFFSLWNSTDNY